MKREIETISKKSIDYKTIYSIFYTISITALFAYIPIVLYNNTDTPNFIHIIFISVFFTTLLLGIVMSIIDNKAQHNQKISLQNVVMDMNEIENYIEKNTTLTDETEKPNDIIFIDECEELIGWKQYLSGKVDLDNFSLNGQFSLKKTGNGDPNGAYKIIGSKFKIGYKLIALIYSPENRKSAKADRIAIEDENFNGYGFNVTPNNKNCQIELRKNGKSIAGYALKEFNIAKNRWYKVEFTVYKNWYSELKIFDTEEQLLCETKHTFDSEYTSFDRISIHGGVNYNVDSLRIERI